MEKMLFFFYIIVARFGKLGKWQETTFYTFFISVTEEMEQFSLREFFRNVINPPKFPSIKLHVLKTKMDGNLGFFFLDLYDILSNRTRNRSEVLELCNVKEHTRWCCYPSSNHVFKQCLCQSWNEGKPSVHMEFCLTLKDKLISVYNSLSQHLYLRQKMTCWSSALWQHCFNTCVCRREHECLPVCIWDRYSGFIWFVSDFNLPLFP